MTAATVLDTVEDVEWILATDPAPVAVVAARLKLSRRTLQERLHGAGRADLVRAMESLAPQRQRAWACGSSACWRCRAQGAAGRRLAVAS